ncbi:YxeA family protein [Enterococcus sp. LJL99]
MKKILKIVIPLILLLAIAWFGYNYYFGGKAYYTKIETVGEESTDIADNGEQHKQFTYSQIAFDADGNKTEQKLYEYRDSPLRMNAYLKLKVNARKGVLSWEEVAEKEVPEKALDKINQE